MKRWRVYFTRTGLVPNIGDHFMEIEGDLVVNNGVLTFWMPYQNDAVYGKVHVPDCFRVIREYSDCIAVNADGQPLRPA